MTALTVIGLGVGLLGLVMTGFALFVALRSRNRRRLGWGVRTSALIGGDSRLRPELDITFHGQAVDEPHAVVVEIRNTGDAPLRRDDFIDPISVHFEPGANWLMATVVADPDERHVAFEKEGGEVFFRPELLQPAESVYVHGLFDGDPGTAVPSARVAGVTILESLRREQTVTEMLGSAVLEALRSVTSVSVVGITIDRTQSRE